MHKVFITAEGEVKKIKYKETFNTGDWFSYIASNIGGRIEGITDDEYKAAKADAKEKAKKAVADYRAKLQEIEQKAYNKLPGKYFYDKNKKDYVYIGAKGAIVKVHKLIDEAYGPNTSRQKYTDQLANELLVLDRIDRSNS